MNTALRLVQVALHMWVVGFVLSTLPVATALWVEPLAPAWAPPGPFTPLTHALGTWLPGAAAWPIAGAALVLAVLGLAGRLRWWGALLLWVCYTNLMHRAWMAGSGGQQLMGILLFWNVPLLAGLRGGSVVAQGLVQLGWWMMRVQVLLAYAVTALHKLNGTLWPAGHALGVVVGDEAFGPAVMVQWPVTAHVLTWGILGFQLLFPMLIWMRPLRPWLLAIGVLFHLGTACWMDIPEMGLAFVAAYSVWLPEGAAQRLTVLVERFTGAVRRVFRSGCYHQP